MRTALMVFGASWILLSFASGVTSLFRVDVLNGWIDHSLGQMSVGLLFLILARQK